MLEFVSQHRKSGNIVTAEMQAERYITAGWELSQEVLDLLSTTPTTRG
jgi:hypothetical protein